jgi:hypothetical protein
MEPTFHWAVFFFLFSIFCSFSSMWALHDLVGAPHQWTQLEVTLSNCWLIGFPRRSGDSHDLGYIQKHFATFIAILPNLWINFFSSSGFHTYYSRSPTLVGHHMHKKSSLLPHIYITRDYFRLYTMLCCSQHGSANLVDLCSYHWRTLVEAKRVMDPNLKFKLAQYYLLPSPQKGCRYYLPPLSVVKYGYIYTLNCI